MNILWLFLPGLLYLGIVTSYTDIKYGKIRNRGIVIGIAYAFAVYIILIAYILVIGNKINFIYLSEILTNALFAIAVAFGLWHYKIWSAGDGKLFFAFALLIPPEIYQYGRYNWIPSITLLFNVFIIGLLAMFFLILKNARLANYKKVFSSFFKNFFKPKTLLDNVVSLFAVFWLVQLALSLVGLGNNVLLRYALTILVFSKLPLLFSKFSSKKSKLKLPNPKLFTMGTITVLRLIVDKSVYSLQFLWGFLLLIFVWRLVRGIFRQGIQSLGKDLFSKEVAVGALKPGMILSDGILRIPKADKKSKKTLSSRGTKVFDKGKFTYIVGNPLPGKEYVNPEPEGVTKKEITKIKKLGIKTLNVSTTIPFAPLIFLGVLATIFFKGNILIVVKILFL